MPKVKFGMSETSVWSQPGMLGMWGKLGVGLVAVLLGLWYMQDSKLDTLRGKRVLVTGASTGIGEQLAYQYASMGCRVVVTSRRLEALKKVTQRCTELSPHNLTHFAVAADLEDMTSAKFVVEEAVSLLGGLDILVLNHISAHPISPFLGTQENLNVFNKVLDVNLRSYVYLTSYAMSQLVANEGSVVVINSLLGKVPHPFLAIYSASKHALHGFFGSLRSQFLALGQNVAVTICTLGFIGTENAIKELQKSKSELMLKLVVPASPESTAKAVVVASAGRQDEMYYPFGFVRAMVYFRSLFPQTGDSLLRLISSIQE